MVRDYFEDLFAGDPVALAITGVILFLLVLFGLVALKVIRDKRRADKEHEERRRRRGY
jgi:hypothetical protein